jgi:hypothetical protein
MYLCQKTEQVQVGRGVGYRVVVFRVELDSSGRPVWTRHSEGQTYASQYASHYYSQKGILFLQRPADGLHVTPGEAARLTGLHAPAALDFLTETVSDSPTIQNFQKPRKTSRL